MCNSVHFSLDESDWSTSLSTYFTPLERACAIQWMGGYMGHSVSLDALKIREVCALAKNYTPVISA